MVAVTEVMCPYHFLLGNRHTRRLLRCPLFPHTKIRSTPSIRHALLYKQPTHPTLTPQTPPPSSTGFSTSPRLAMGWNGSRRSGGGAGGRGRGRGPASPNDLQRERVAASLIDAAARLGLQATDAGTCSQPPRTHFDSSPPPPLWAAFALRSTPSNCDMCCGVRPSSSSSRARASRYRLAAGDAVPLRVHGRRPRPRQG
jgi:hypothetical protein